MAVARTGFVLEFHLGLVETYPLQVLEARVVRVVRVVLRFLEVLRVLEVLGV